MLAIFGKSVASPPEELKCPISTSQKLAKHPVDILRAFHSSNSNASVSTSFAGDAVLAHSPRPNPASSRFQYQSYGYFCGYDDMYCLFYGRLDNLSSLIRQYGLSKATNEAMLVIEAYRTLRDRAPYPVDQVLNDLSGSFAFVLYDNKSRSVFASLGGATSRPNDAVLYWGLAGDGSLVFSDQLDVLRAGCSMSFAPFPQGCMFHSKGGLKSFEHPMNKMKAMTRVDSEGVICGATFKVDTYARVPAMPRVGSDMDCTAWASH